MAEHPADERAALLEERDALSGEIGRRRADNRPVDDLIARHRAVSARLKALQDDAPAVSSASLGLCVSIETAPAGFLQLRDEWNDLVTHSAAATPFILWEWLYTWWEIFGDAKSLRIILVRAGEKGPLIAAAPLMLGLRERGRIHAQTLAFIGTGEVAEGDYFTLILRTGAGTQALEALLGTMHDLAAECDAVRLRDVCTTDPVLLECVARWLGKNRGVFIETRRQSVSGELPEDFETFIKSVPDKQRRNYLRDMERHIRKAADNVQWVSLHDWALIDAALSSLGQFNISRQRRKGGQSAWADPSFARFMRRVCERLGERGAVILDTLVSNGDDIAVLLGFALGGRYYCYQMGFAAQAATLSPLHYLLGRRLQACIEDGYKSFDFLAGEHEYKTQYFAGRKPVGQMTLLTASPRSRLRIAGDLLRQGIKGKIKSWYSQAGTRPERTTP